MANEIPNYDAWKLEESPFHEDRECSHKATRRLAHAWKCVICGEVLDD